MTSLDREGEFQLPPTKWQLFFSRVDGLVTFLLSILLAVVVMLVALTAVILVLLALGKLAGVIGPGVCVVGCYPK